MKLEGKIREIMRFKHYSLRTEESYVAWHRRFVRHHGLRHPEEMGAAEVEAVLTDLAVNRRVVAATQNQALNGLVFLFKEVLEKRFEGVDAMRAQQSKRLPVVLSVEETRKLLMVMTGEEAVMGKLLYGCGLRVMECLRLRVKDVDEGRGIVTVREAKRDKHRTTMLPESLQVEVAETKVGLRKVFESDRARGCAGVAFALIFIHISRSSSQRHGSLKPGPQCRVLVYKDQGLAGGV